MAKIREITISQLTKILENSVFSFEELPKIKEITSETKLSEDLGMDSLDKYEFGYALEENLEISIPDENIQGFRTMGELKDYLESH